MKQVVLYTRAGCGLCEVAKEVILAVQRDLDFVFREVDIDSDAELFEEHRYDIPVIEIDGRCAFKHRVDPQALKKKL
jgi:glutaredoxin